MKKYLICEDVYEDYGNLYISTDEISDFISDYLPNDIYDELEEKGYIW